MPDNFLQEQNREVNFKRNQNLETLLQALNQQLICAEEQTLSNKIRFGSDFPLIFIMGPLRSGTTLFTQWLASTEIIAYPTNLLSRFYGAPAIGAQIQLLLTDPRFNFRNEIIDFNSKTTFESENGKTRGALAPNEFWYFWRRFLPFKELDWLPDSELFRLVDHEKLADELTTLTRIFTKPFSLKAMILNYNIPFLDAIFKKALFIQIKRDSVTNVASILEARKRQLGSESEWYSFKIPEYYQLKDLDPIPQAAGQLHYINTAVTEGMATVDESRKMIVQYEEFCQHPKRFFLELLQKLGNAETAYDYVGPEQFTISRSAKEIKQRKEIEEAMLLFEAV